MDEQVRLPCALFINRCLTFLDGKEIQNSRPGRRPNTTIERLVYITLITIFDTLDAVLRWARRFDKKIEDIVRKMDHALGFAPDPCFDLAHRI